MNLSRKLITSFGVVIVLFIVLTLVAISQMSQLAGAAEKPDISSASWFFAFLNLIAAGVTVGVAIWLNRSIVGQLGGEPAEAAAVAQSVGAGDLSVYINVQPGDSTSLMAQLKAMRDNLIKVVGEVRNGSDAISTASAEIAQGNHDLSSRTEQQASALQQTASSMDQLNQTVKQNADGARQANQLAMSSSALAVKGGEVVAQVVDTMKGINESSRKISDIIGVIDGIAFQTNILALNAAVEAARAGEQGRGFAVVASEVRSLAGRSADAAKEIKSLINASVERVEHGTLLVDQAGSTMTEVVSSIRRVTDIMGEISAASTEQAAGVTQVGQSVSQMDQTTQQNAALVEQMAAAASGLKNQAQDLVSVVAVFKLNESDTPGMSTRRAPAARQMATSAGPKLMHQSQKPMAAAKRPASSGGSAKALSAPLSSRAKPKAAASNNSAGGDEDWTTF